MKKIIGCCLLLLQLLITIGSPVTLAEQKQIKVIVNGQELTAEQSPFIYEGTTLVPLRSIFEEMDISLSWEEKTRKIIGTTKNTKIELQVGNKTATINGQRIAIEVPPMIVDGTTMVPLRFISEATAKNISWDQIDGVVQITSGIEFHTETSYFARDSFDPLNLSKQYGVPAPVIYEENGYTYVLWSRDDSNGGTSYKYTEFFVSIAKNEEWLVKGKSILKVNKATHNMKIILNNSILIRDYEGIQRVKINEHGDVILDETIVENQRPGTLLQRLDQEILLPVQSESGPRFIFGDKNSLRMYKLENPKEFEGILDNHRILTTSPNKYSLFTYNQKTHNLMLIEGISIKQLNVANGEVIFDENGQDKVIKPAKQSLSPPSYYDGRIYYVYQDSDKRLKITSIDLDMNVSTTPTNYVPTERKRIILTQIGDEFRLWNTAEFDRRPSLQQVTLMKNKGQ
ncbi:stalk domain-containing protein [Paenibacillus sp. NPDC056579]|uniref:stalk domain-containing protein n=1 Tax=Paenibacillus sp. NPDC056579 TaxID=3345871 RepID=UPI0036C94002